MEKMLYHHIMIIILLSICCIDGSEGAIDTNKRLRGVPMTDTNEGNKFCFAFLDSEGSGTGDSQKTKNLGIYIGTQETEPVQYRIRSGVSDVSRTGIVQPGQIKRELYRHITDDTNTDLTTTPPTIANMLPLISTGATARSINDHTGIIVETVNSSQKISVMGFSDAIGSSDGFAAVPILNVSSIVQSYSYSIFTGSGTSAPQAAIVACDRIESGEIVLNYPAAILFNFLNTPAGYFNTAPSLTPSQSIIPFEQYYTPVITRNEEIAGITAVSTQPIGFMTGHQCGEVLQDIINCDHYVEQIPPSYTWGYNFLISPFHSRDFGYIIKILPFYNSNADFKLFCVNASNGAVTRNLSVENYVLSQRLEADKGVFNIAEQAYCTIQSNKPIAVMQYAKGHQVDDPAPGLGSTKTVQDLADPAMTWVPSASQYLNKYLISNQVDLISDDVINDPFTSNGVYVTVLQECFNASAILDNDTVLESDASKWGRFYCDNLTDVCGYGISVDISIGDHLLVHTDSTCSFSAVLFGWGDQKGYAYPAGFGMRPIAETFYSIAAVPSCEDLLVDITVYRSGDLSQTSHIGVMINGDDENIRNVSFSTDESSQMLPVNITSLQDEDIIIKLIKSDEVNLGCPSSLLITVNDNGTIEVNSSVHITPTHCTMTSDTNTQTEVYSSSFITNKHTSSLIMTSISSTVISTTGSSSPPVTVSISLITTSAMIGLTAVLFIISMLILVTLTVYALYHNKAMAKNSNRGIDNAMYGVHEPQAKK